MRGGSLGLLVLQVLGNPSTFCGNNQTVESLGLLFLQVLGNLGNPPSAETII